MDADQADGCSRTAVLYSFHTHRVSNEQTLNLHQYFNHDVCLPLYQCLWHCLHFVKYGITALTCLQPETFSIFNAEWMPTGRAGAVALQ